MRECERASERVNLSQTLPALRGRDLTLPRRWIVTDASSEERKGIRCKSGHDAAAAAAVTVAAMNEGTAEHRFQRERPSRLSQIAEE